MKKLLKLKSKVEKLHSNVVKKLSTEPVQYWRGGDWQIQGIEKTYSNILKEIEKLINPEETKD